MPRRRRAASRPSVTMVLPEPDRAAATIKPLAVMLDAFRRDGSDRAHYRQHNEPPRSSAPQGLDNRHLRHGSRQGCLYGAADRRLPGPDRGGAAAWRATVFRARAYSKG